MKCIFCGEEREEVLHQHHVFPKFILDTFELSESERAETVTVCRNCHAIIHDVLLKPIENILKAHPELIQKLGEPGEEPGE